MKQVNISDYPRAPRCYWGVLADKIVALPEGKALLVTSDEFPSNGFTNFRQTLYYPLKKRGKLLRSQQTGKHEVLLWAVNFEK